MTWARIDDGFYSHPKIEKTSFAARGLFVTAISYSAAHLTNGHVSDQTMRRLTAGSGGRAGLRELLDRGLVARADGDGYVIHDFLDFNPSREEVEAERRKNRDKQRHRRATPRLWNGSCTPGTTPPPSRAVGAGELPPTEEASEVPARAPVTGDATVDRVLAILWPCEWLICDEVRTPVQVANAIAALPTADALGAAHVALTWAASEDFTMSDGGAVFLAALRKQPLGSGGTTDQRAAAAVYEGAAKCADCGRSYERNSPKRRHPNAGRCDDCSDRFEARHLGEEVVA